MSDRVSESSAAEIASGFTKVAAPAVHAPGVADVVLAAQRDAGNAAVARLLPLMNPRDRVVARQQAAQTPKASEESQPGIDLSRRIPLTADQATQVRGAEVAWRAAHQACLRKFADLILRALRGAEELRRFDPVKDPEKTLSAEDALVVRGLQKYMSIYPRTLDLRKIEAQEDQRMVLRLLKLLSLLMQVANRVETYLFYPIQPPRATTAAEAHSPMTIYPTFFASWKDELGPAKAIMHEYFHYLAVPGMRQPVYHGSTATAVSGADSALMDAYALADFVMWVGAGRAVEGI